MGDARKRPARKQHGRVEEAAEHVADAIRDAVREVELGLDQGDHTIVGEISGVIEEVAHPDGTSDKPGRRRRR